MTPARSLRVGLILNPIAGMGGAVGLKGTDGDLLRQALARGARPHAARRALVALRALLPMAADMELLVCAGDMGAVVARDAGLPCVEVYRPASPSTAADTRAAVAVMLREQVDLLLFAGGDGTAREILLAGAGTPAPASKRPRASVTDPEGAAALQPERMPLDGVPVLGIPAGVKMHSAVFGVTPRTAGDAALQFLQAGCAPALLSAAEVMDRALPAEGEPPASPELYGFLQVPRMPRLVQAAKAAGATADGSLAGALRELAAQLREMDLCLLGPGATLAQLKTLLGGPVTVLGVDVFARGRGLLADASEAQLWSLLSEHPQARVRIVVGVVGGQGFVFGRGNQQFSARVLARVGRENIEVVASAAKLLALPDGALRVDTGDPAVDALFSGYVQVRTGSGRRTLCPLLLPAS